MSIRGNFPGLKPRILFDPVNKKNTDICNSAYKEIDYNNLTEDDKHNLSIIIKMDINNPKHSSCLYKYRIEDDRGGIVQGYLDLYDRFLLYNFKEFRNKRYDKPTGYFSAIKFGDNKRNVPEYYYLHGPFVLNIKTFPIRDIETTYHILGEFSYDNLDGYYLIHNYRRDKNGLICRTLSIDIYTIDNGNIIRITSISDKYNEKYTQNLPESMGVIDINIISGETTLLGNVRYYGCDDINNLDYNDLINNVDNLYQ